MRRGKSEKEDTEILRLENFFKEIDLSEKKSTGISKILRELKRNGSPLPEFETDVDRTYNDYYNKNS